MAKYAKRRASMEDTVYSMHKIMESLTNKDLVSFGGGAPAKEAYPIERIGEISQSIFKDEDKALQALGYGPTIGSSSLREAVRKYLLAPKGIEASLDEIMITSGGIQGLYLACKLFIDPGDVILVESPTFIHAKMLFDSFEAVTVSCPMESDGLNMQVLEDKIKKYSPKIIYTMPTFHNPTGISMSIDKRKELAAFAEKYDVIIVEDDPYSEIRYTEEAFRPVKAYTLSKNIIYANSFSKIFSPGARLGYMVADAEIMQELQEMKLATDTCTNGFAQAICAEFFSGGYYQPHVKTLRNIYKARRDTMLKAIDTHFPKGFKRTNPAGGFYVWVELPGELDAKALLPEAINETKVTYCMGRDFFVEENERGNQFLRLSFAGKEESVIESGIRALGQFFKSKLSV